MAQIEARQHEAAKSRVSSVASFSGDTRQFLAGNDPVAEDTGRIAKLQREMVDLLRQVLAFS
jgi:hypothetical protein